VSDRDASAIASWTRHDQGDDPGAPYQHTTRYSCAGCCWTSTDYMAALEHHVQQAHQIEIKNAGHWGPIPFAPSHVQRMRERLEKTK
jgi:hypothetical protein